MATASVETRERLPVREACAAYWPLPGRIPTGRTRADALLKHEFVHGNAFS
jgi:hypothetical protein